MTDEEKVAREWLEREIDGYDPKTWSGEIASLAALLRQRDARVRREAVEMEREACAKVAENEPELSGEPPTEVVIDFRNKQRAVAHLRAAVRSTKKCIAAAIRAVSTPPPAPESP